MVDALSILSAIGSLGALASVISVAYWLGKKFSEIDAKFKLIDERFKRIDERFERLGNAFTSYQEFLIEFLSREGVIKSGDKELLINEARRVMRLALANPMTKEELEKLREYLDKSEKDELTPEEADEFLELARKFAWEYGNRPEAWKLHIYATITRALVKKKWAEKKEREVQASTQKQQ
ncbi:hypothetical protein QPL79_05805 [Ignisphaera sp. 4213-co]|uniref:Uncharacterized protein n=1 Tax=Ignisphaera cupida TaxID=3050454 RepID=A0ABD4Z785_9CREN|nr:hypothetical protein [Ignisphaera sp. 4213-co]MDK6028872.1 hypothetical protein [Ignisphaera sp. 4213-co]